MQSNHQSRFKVGTFLKFHSNLGLSLGMVSEQTESPVGNIFSTGWLENGEGTFEIVETPTHMAGSIHWSTRIMRKHSFNASYIEKVEVVK
jgi:hypothetical protein